MNNMNTLEQKQKGPKKSDLLKDAISRQNLEETLKLLDEINDFLIGERGTFNMYRPHREEINDLLLKPNESLKIFVGDGGLSRLFIDKRDGKIRMWIDGNSTDEVKEKWEEMEGRKNG